MKRDPDRPGYPFMKESNQVPAALLEIGTPVTKGAVPFPS
jgi:hypothetical protein